MAKKAKPPVQTALFDVKPDEFAMKHAVVLYEPNLQRLKQVTEELCYGYTKDELYQQCQVFHPMLKHKLLLLQKPDGERVPASELMPMFSMSSYKESMARALAYILSDERNLQSYVDLLSEEMKELWQHLLLNIYCSEATAMKILKTSDTLFSSDSSWYYARSANWNKRGFDFFSLTRSLSADKARWGYREERFYIRMKSYVQGLFFPLFFSDAYGDPTISQLPDNQFLLFDFEEECHTKYNLLSSLIQTGKVQIKVKGVSQADVKRAAKQLGMEEFFDETSTMQSAIHSQFYIGTMALADAIGICKGKKRAGYPDMLRQMMAQIEKFRHYLPSLLLPHVTGLRKSMTNENKLPQLCRFMLTWLADNPDRWSPIEAIFVKIYAGNVGNDSLQSCVMVFPSSEQSSSVLITNEFSGKNIAVDSFVVEFGLTSLRAFAFLLCSLGIAELAVSPLKRHESPFACAEYLRLTPLGCYVLGVTGEYEAPAVEQTAYFELDPDRLIIRSLVEPNPYAQLLLDTSVSISRNRFETSAQSFLSHCDSRSDVEEKIGIFRQFVSKELPPLWKQFFDSLLQHCNPLPRERADYYIYHLSPDNTDLIRLLTSTPSLRKLFIRAEGYLILVKKDDQRKFIDELKKYGYLL